MPLIEVSYGMKSVFLKGNKTDLHRNMTQKSTFLSTELPVL